MSDANVGQPVRKIRYIDLLQIADPNKLSRTPTVEGVVGFPFSRSRTRMWRNATRIVVGNDNNLPFSSSREPNKADDNELVLLGGFLRAQ
jgi:hypothetical protein